MYAHFTVLIYLENISHFKREYKIHISFVEYSSRAATAIIHCYYTQYNPLHTISSFWSETLANGNTRQKNWTRYIYMLITHNFIFTDSLLITAYERYANFAYTGLGSLCQHRILPTLWHVKNTQYDSGFLPDICGLVTCLSATAILWPDLDSTWLSMCLYVIPSIYCRTHMLSRWPYTLPYGETYKY